MSFRPVLLLTLAALCQSALAEKLRYNRDIRPILSDNCFACHGPDKNHREADLRLDDRQAAIEMKAILPGKPEASSILERIHTTDPQDVMPPPESKKTLTDAQKRTLEEWIRQGADYEPHWAYTPLRKPALPAGSKAGANGVDAFIQQALAARGISPSPMAGARTLIRRLSLDLTGLPPTPKDVAQFEKDFTNAPAEAVKSWTGRLMKSPHFGERWAVWWLDVARFADTVGFHGDQNQRIFPYRDYVIRAFNSNKKFDQFTLEQLAGDLLPDPTQEQLVATGFNQLNMMTREGGAQPKEYLAKYQADRVRTVGGTWLGATLGCAECHDHKFDPFTAHDFYAMSAYFADVKQFGVYASYRYTPVEELTGWSNEHPFPPELLVDSPYLKEREQKLIRQRNRLAFKAVKSAPEEVVEAWKRDLLHELKTAPEMWKPLPQAATTVLAPPPRKGPAPKPKPGTTQPADPSTITQEADGRWVVQAKGAQNSVVTVRPEAPLKVAAIRLELLPHASHQGSFELNGSTAGLTVQPAFILRPASEKKDRALAVFQAEASAKVARYSGTVEIPGVASGWKTPADKAKTPLVSEWILDEAVEVKPGDSFSVKLAGHSLGGFRLSFASVPPPAPLAAAGWERRLQRALEKMDAPSPALTQAWMLSRPSAAAEASFAETKAAWRVLNAQVLECNGGKAWTQVTVAVKDPLEIRRLPRGNWMDETGELCPPAPPSFLVPASLGKNAQAAAPEPRQTRLDLARWLTSDDNPLTARTFVNRLWKQFFGNGLSLAVDDLGAQGETPSHPELLDWLACEFRDSGWDVQHVMRLIVTSHTYLQDSRTRAELKDADPGNRLLAFQNPRRLDAEFVRDNALSAAGLLNLDIGGPSVKPYQPGGYYENLQFPSRDYTASTDDRQWRRGVYMHWQRTFLHPMLANFDAPARDECTASRNVSNTPQQALTLLNDPTFVEAARTLAEKLPEDEDPVRLRRAYERCLGRRPSPAEEASLLRFLEVQREVYAAAPQDAEALLRTGLRPAPAQADAVELAAWTSLCRVVLNLHETITRY